MDVGGGENIMMGKELLSIPPLLSSFKHHPSSQHVTANIARGSVQYECIHEFAGK